MLYLEPVLIDFCMRAFRLALYFSGIFALFVSVSYAQNTSAKSNLQTLRGQVVDGDVKAPLSGAIIEITDDSSKVVSVTTDDIGVYRTKVRPGRVRIKVTAKGYQNLYRDNLLIVSGKQAVEFFELKPTAVQTQMVEVSSARGQLNNDMAINSATSFNMEDSKRMAASRDDIGRMVANLAGVSTADDSRNDIVVRGNSPTGVLWRLEGIDIPNPNHFAVIGTTGGPVTMLNNKLLRNSDFYTSAFPAEYGNALGAAFDVKMRTGNTEDHEFAAQIGILGIEGVAEGPFKKGGESSYIVGYRYSTLSLINSLGINFGAAGTPVYQDLNFKLSFKLPKNATFNIWGVGGISDYALLNSQRDPSKWSFGSGNTDIRFGTRTGVVGANYTLPLGQSVLGLGIAQSVNTQYTTWDSVATNSPVGNPITARTYFANFLQTRTTASIWYQNKVGSQGVLRSGMFAHYLGYDLIDSGYRRWLKGFRTDILYKGGALLLQPYSQLKYNLSDKLVATVGLHGMLHNQLSYTHFAVNPRAGLRYTMGNSALTLGVGQHSQIQGLNIYFMLQPDTLTSFHGMPNTNLNNLQARNAGLGFTNAWHSVIGYETALGASWRAKAEAYFQYLYDVPVEVLSSSVSALNQGGDFKLLRPGLMRNGGLGRNMGVELTIERAFKDSWFLMFNTSIYDSRYTGSDGVWRNTQFNGNYVVNLLAGKEWQVGKDKRTTLGAHTKIGTSGARRFTPLNLNATLFEGDLRYEDSQAYSQQYANFFRWDMRFTMRNNFDGWSQEFSIDLINVTNYQNVLGQAFDFYRNQTFTEYQLSFTPLVNYLIEF